MPEKNKLKIPATVENAYEMLDEMLTKREKSSLKKATQEELLLMHFGLGLRIRNEWLYPETEGGLMKLFLDNGVIHQDSMSMFIIEGYKRHLNGKPSDIRSILGYKPEKK